MPDALEDAPQTVGVVKRAPHRFDPPCGPGVRPCAGNGPRLLQMFARSWSPRGPLLLLAEGVYSLTDPPLRLLRRVIPPVRLGGVALDFSFLVLLIALQIAISALSRL